MNMKKVLLLVGALMIAVVAAFTAKNLYSGGGAPQAEAAPIGPKVLVARKALPVGTIIDQEALVYQPWPQELMESAYYVEGNGADVASLVGTVVRYPMAAGQPITRGSLVGPQDRGFLAAALGPGMRAVTIEVEQDTGVAGFVFPGDHVDVVLTQEVRGGGDGPPLNASETIVRNVRVLASDQRVTDKDDEGKTVATPAEYITLEVTPRIAEKLAVSKKVGDLSLVLRSIADNTAELERAVAVGDVKVGANNDPKKEREMLIAAANRPMDSNTSFTTGGDVSRFQRRTVPGKPGGNSDIANLRAGAEALRDARNGVGGQGGAAVPLGPVVRVARGNDVVAVPVGGR